jgi:hypothetical protein
MFSCDLTDMASHQVQFWRQKLDCLPVVAIARLSAAALHCKQVSLHEPERICAGLMAWGFMLRLQRLASRVAKCQHLPTLAYTPCLCSAYTPSCMLVNSSSSLQSSKESVNTCSENRSLTASPCRSPQMSPCERQHFPILVLWGPLMKHSLDAERPAQLRMANKIGPS